MKRNSIMEIIKKYAESVHLSGEKVRSEMESALRHSSPKIVEDAELFVETVACMIARELRRKRKQLPQGHRP